MTTPRHGNFISENKPRINLGLFWLVAVLIAVALSAGCTQKATVQTQQLVSEPVIPGQHSQQLVEGDFEFPPSSPSLTAGKKVYDSQCLKCHTAGFWQGDKAKKDLAYTTPIDLYILLTTGQKPDVVMPTRERPDVLPASHEAFRDKISRDDRWAVIMFTRYLAGAGDIQSPSDSVDVANIFGGNCAVCHGTRGQADGPLHIGKTGLGHEVKDAQIKNAFEPAPANFTQYNRMYNRTDAQLFKYICQGIYPSAMPSWYGNVDQDAASGNINYVFDDFLIWNLVRHVRLFTYTNDLSPEAMAEYGLTKTPAGLVKLDACPTAPSNRPWTKAMEQYGPKTTDIPTSTQQPTATQHHQI